jgi:hypothetical protein
MGPADVTLLLLLSLGRATLKPVDDGFVEDEEDEQPRSLTQPLPKRQNASTTAPRRLLPPAA